MRIDGRTLEVSTERGTVSREGSRSVVTLGSGDRGPALASVRLR